MHSLLALLIFIIQQYDTPQQMIYMFAVDVVTLFGIGVFEW